MVAISILRLVHFFGTIAGDIPAGLEGFQALLGDIPLLTSQKERRVNERVNNNRRVGDGEGEARVELASVDIAKVIRYSGKGEGALPPARLRSRGALS